MPTLADILLGAEHRSLPSDPLVQDCVQRIEAQIAARGGLKGLGMKTALAMLKAAKPGILPRALARLLPEFAQALEPLYRQFRAERGKPAQLARFLVEHQAIAIAALLAVADARAGVASAPVRSAYARLRGGAEEEIGALWPALAQALAARVAAA